jgi:5S rRNA maturation endonuclease (ribonuclease M5)
MGAGYGVFEAFFPNEDSNSSDELRVRCPFHKEGKEENKSASINLDKRVFHCQTCAADGRGGMSEVQFYATLHDMSYDEAVELLSQTMELKNDSFKKDVWIKHQQSLWNRPDSMDYLREKRGFTEETIRKYYLGTDGSGGIVYPIIINGDLLDKRTYDRSKTPKMRSEKSKTPLLYPFDVWKEDEHPTILVEGENDALLARQYGFNALTVTGGAGSFNKMFLPYFKDKAVYICYDCDDAGRKGALSVALLLSKVTNKIRIVDLELANKEDLTDWFVTHSKTVEELKVKLIESIEFTPEMAIQERERSYPLVQLYDVPKGEHHGQNRSARVVMSGAVDSPMRVPSVIEWTCKQDAKDLCVTCPMRYKHNGHAWWTLKEDNCQQLLKIAEVNEDMQTKHLRQFMSIPSRCPSVRMMKKAQKEVHKVFLTPDPDVIQEEEFQMAEIVGYTVGNRLDHGQKYRVFFKSYPHPLDKQRVVAVINDVTASDNAINTFKMTPELKKQLDVFQGDPHTKMKELAERAVHIHSVPKRYNIHYAVDLFYHSVLSFQFRTQMLKKGYPEILLVGETRTGKSETFENLMKWYGLGEMVSSKHASVAGLAGGVDKLPNGQHVLKLGVLPLNHRGGVCLEEISGMSPEVISKLTDIRSSGVVNISKIEGGKAPALVRLFWQGNARVQSTKRTLPLMEYPTGVEVVLELIGSAEDVSRFDMVLLEHSDAVPFVDVDELKEVTPKPFDQQLYRSLVLWAWSRRPEQVIFDDSVESYIVQKSKELNEQFDCDVKFLGVEAWKKIARMSVACAARLFSCSASGEEVLVKKEHVDWVCDFISSSYTSEVFRLPQYVQSKKMYTQVDTDVEQIVEGLCKNNFPMMKVLSEQTELSLIQLKSVAGLDKNGFDEVFSTMTQHYLIQIVSDKVRPSYRLRKALDKYRKNYESMNMLRVDGGGQRL